MDSQSGSKSKASEAGIQPVPFDKYREFQAYHWNECQAGFSNYLDYNPALVARYSLVLEEVRRLGRPRRLIDLGCGDGYLVGQCASLTDSITGVDSEWTGIRWAREKLGDSPGVGLLTASVYRLPFRTAQFDIAISSDVIEHLEAPETHLEESRRILRPGGVLILTTPMWRPDRSWDERHYHEYKPDELQNLADRFFETVELKFFWPMAWCKLYSTRIGWRLIKLLSLSLHNPFLGRTSAHPRGFGQILAVCRKGTL